jgi:hypothetical protein
LFVLAFLDDSLIYNNTRAEHLQHVRLVLLTLHQHKFAIKQSNCSFCETSISYLSHIISNGGVAMDLTMVEAVQAWPHPTTVKGLQGFLGSPITTVNSSKIMVWSLTSSPSF